MGLPGARFRPIIRGMQLVWHRGDLRTHDHPALHAASSAGPSLGVVILDPKILDETSARRKAWFTVNVLALRQSYAKRGSALLVREGVPWELLPRLALETGATAVHAIKSYTPYGRSRDELTAKALTVPLHWHAGQYVQEPGSVRRDDGGNYTVYTPYAKRWWAKPMPIPLAVPSQLPAVVAPVSHGEIPVLEADVPLPIAGEDAAMNALDAFIKQKLSGYDQGRNRLDGSGSSGLSVYLNIGVLSPRVAAHRAHAVGGAGSQKWVAELAWRDFGADLMWHRPDMLRAPFDARWSKLVWMDDRAGFEAWCEGRTGYPVIDAAMRELKATGYMSNRCRMVVAQFFSKLLLLPWTWGEKVFKDWLLDGDTAQNVAGWQWASGLGVDAAPYFRVFNPVSQGAEHDPGGSWIRRWVPESHGAPDALPGAIVDAGEARKRYLDVAGQIGRTK